jgi:hypothetical protein
MHQNLSQTEWFSGRHLNLDITDKSSSATHITPVSTPWIEMAKMCMNLPQCKADNSHRVAKAGNI